MSAIESTKPAQSVDTSDREISTTRVFDAPRELVWKVWTEPEHIAKWWGPRGFSTTTEKMDVRPGGEWRHVMHGPDGKDYQNRITYVEVVKPVGEKTELSMRMLFETAELRDKTDKTFGAIKGQKETIDRLGEYVSVMQTAGNSSAS